MPVDPTTYGLGQILTSPLVMIGLALILGGLGALVWMFRGQLGYYEPEIPAVIQPSTKATLIHPVQPIAPNYHRSGEYPQVTPQAHHIRQHWRREDSDTQVIPSIPGATLYATEPTPSPVRPSAPEERAEEAQPVEPALEELAPQFAALARFLDAVDAEAEVTDEALVRIVDNLAGRDCPLTTQEIRVPDDAGEPFYDAAVRGDTVELSGKVKKILEAHP